MHRHPRSDRGAGAAQDEHPRREAGAQRNGLAANSLAAVELVRKRDQLSRCVVEGDVAGLDAEDLLDPLADEVDDPVELELTGDRGTDFVDERQLGVALPSPRSRGA